MKLTVILITHEMYTSSCAELNMTDYDLDQDLWSTVGFIYLSTLCSSVILFTLNPFIRFIAQKLLELYYTYFLFLPFPDMLVYRDKIISHLLSVFNFSMANVLRVSLVETNGTLCYIPGLPHPILRVTDRNYFSSLNVLRIGQGRCIASF